MKAKAKYCFCCDSFPCVRLNHLDKRYRTKYGMSMIDNLENIRKFGIRHFIRNEKEGGDVLNAVRCSAFTGRNVFIVSIRGVRMLKRFKDSPTKAATGHLKPPVMHALGGLYHQRKGN